TKFDGVVRQRPVDGVQLARSKITASNRDVTVSGRATAICHLTQTPIIRIVGETHPRRGNGRVGIANRTYRVVEVITVGCALRLLVGDLSQSARGAVVQIRNF